MRKIFLLISIFFLALTAKATVINLTTSTYGENDNLRKAVYYATAGDTIVMAEGTYFEPSTGGYLSLNKDLVIMAAEGANVVVQLQAYAQLTNAAKIKFQGINFDGSLQGSYDYFFRAYDVSASSLTVENCEFYNIKNEVFRAKSDVHMDSLIVNNCYFHNNKKNIVYFENGNTEGRQTCDKLVITNSTVANTDSLKNYTSTIDIRPFGTDNTDAIKVIIDHCTFYNNPTINTDHSAIRPYHLTDVKISNCIFVKGPDQKGKRNATSCYGGTISNCLVYDLDYSSGGHRSGPTVTNNIVADPLFVNVATGFSFYGNWTTGNVSPAREAASDGSDLGDPRWYTEETIPSTNFAADYNCSGVLALAVDRMEHDASNYIKSKNSGGSAVWKIYATRGCVVQVTLNLLESYELGHNYKVEIYDAEGNSKGSLIEGWHTSRGDSLLSGVIQLPKADVYKVVLTNEASGSTTTIKGITLSYYGGAIQAVSPSANTTLNVADALFTSGATRAEGQITYSSWSSADAWVKWNIATSETKFYDLTLNFSSDNAHSMAVNIYEDEEASPVATISESWTDTHGTLTISDRVNLVGGKNYVVKVTNPTSGSHAKVTNVVFAPVMAATTSLPNTLAFSDAVLSDKAHITDDMLYFNEIGDKDPVGQWAQWEVTTDQDHDGLFLFTMNVTSENEQSYKITILDNSENILDFCETSLGSGDQEIKHYFALETGSYFVKVENTRSYSKGHLVSFAVTEATGVVTIDEAATDNTSWVSNVVDKDADGPYYDVQIIRTIKAGMNNTFCLPFAVSSSQCKEIFGNDVELRILENATIKDNVLNLEFKTASDIYPGTPVLIKTSRDIVNPVLVGVKFTIAAPSATTKTNANYTGTFVKSTLLADENILFLGANNKLYFPTATIDIYGMRGWFVVHDIPSGAPSLRGARIIEQGNVATEIEIVRPELEMNSRKLLKDGQLIIIKDGVRYNALGQKLH